MANDEANLFSSGGGVGVTARQRVIRRKGALFSDRSPWDMRWKSISTNLLPFAGRFFADERNKGEKSFNNIIDEHATFALRTLAAGMMSGMTSPARPWFRLATPDDDLMEFESVKLWLAKVTRLMRDVFARGNTYRALHTIYEELGAFNTAVNIVQPDFENVIWNHPLTVGEYAIAQDRRGRVNTLVREYEMTVENIVEEFVVQPNGQPDWSRVSPGVKNLWDNFSYEKGVRVIHLIEPRRMRERDLKDRFTRGMPKNMPWRSIYVEAGGDNDQIVLRESGFKDFPVLGARWHTRGGDTYGVGPGMEALGSIKQLQQEQFRKSQGIDYMARPPIALPGEMHGREIDSLPGGVNFLNIAPQGAKAQNLFDVRIDLQHLLADIQDVRGRIDRAFYADLFLMISQMEGVQPRNTLEIAERQQEKLLMLGPVLERLHDELLSPMIDITFANLLEGGALPPPPRELENVELKVEFVSVLAQAQRAVGLGSVDRLLGTVGNMVAASGRSEAWDKIDIDEAVERYADMLAIDPELIVSDGNVAMVRASRAEAQAAQAQQAMIPEAAKAMKAGAEAGAIMNESGGSAGTPAGSISQFTGYAP